MGRRSNSIVGWIVLAAVALVVSSASAATLVDRARLREGPSKDTKLLGWVEQDVAVTVESGHGGWYLVRTPDGQTGYIWQEHLRFEPQEAAQVPARATPPSTTSTPATLATLPPPAAAPATSPPPTLPPTPPPTTVERSDGGLAGELERLRGEVGRLTASQQELLQRLGRSERSGTGGAAPAPLGSDGSTGAAILFFGAGAVVGWLFGRFGPGRRDRRSRLRL